jgi:hypothetical protein
MSAEAAPQEQAREHAADCQCGSCERGLDVQRVVTPDERAVVGRLCRPCRKAYWGVSS